MLYLIIKIILTPFAALELLLRAFIALMLWDDLILEEGHSLEAIWAPKLIKEKQKNLK